jgi:hypothetical protein
MSALGSYIRLNARQVSDHLQGPLAAGNGNEEACLNRAFEIIDFTNVPDYSIITQWQVENVSLVLHVVKAGSLQK